MKSEEFFQAGISFDTLFVCLFVCLYTFTHFLKSKDIFSRGVLLKILALCMSSIQERFLIKSGLWWHNNFLMWITLPRCIGRKVIPAWTKNLLACIATDYRHCLFICLFVCTRVCGLQQAGGPPFPSFFSNSTWRSPCGPLWFLKDYDSLMTNVMVPGFYLGFYLKYAGLEF
jgi:hypothetical protein